MGKPTPQTFSTLLAAEQPDDILQAIAKCIWEADKNEGDPPVPSISDIQEFTSVPESPIEGAFVQRIGECYFVWQAMTLRFSELSKNLEDVPIFVATEDDFSKGIDETQIKAWAESILDENQDDLKEWLKIQLKEPGWPHLKNTRDFKAISNHLLRTAGEPTRDGAQWLHQEWKSAREQDAELVHPITTIVREWIQTQTAKRITPNYDKKHPGAVLKPPLGSVRNVIISQANGTEKVGQLRGISAPAPESQQIELPGLEMQSLLPAVLPLENVRLVNGTETTKRGAVAMPIRLFFEALMALNPKETQADIHIKLGDLLHFLNPDGKYNRTNHLPYVLHGLHSLYELRIPYRGNPDNPNTEVDWIPVLPRTVPNMNSGDDASIILEVKLPPDARGGMMVEKEILRQTGKQSSAKFNAYLTACWIFDRYGTTPKGIIDPTKPAAQRDTEGYLTNTTGDRIFDERGKPIKNRYHPRNIAAGDRVDNEAREQYPILSFEDLTRACFPKGFNTKQKRLYKKRALKAWEALEADGILRIEKHIQGWRILPSDSHIGRYRALQKNVY